MDLSFLIPARQEEFLATTIANLLANIRGDSEIIVVCDGAWADPPIPDHPRVRLIYRPTAIGQRAATNLAARISTAKYVCKLDAHCAIDEGFDVKMLQAADECGRDTTLIPAMINLHAFNWRCKACGREVYQGPAPTRCEAGERDRELAVLPPPCGAAQGFERVMIWEPRRRQAKGNGSEGNGNYARTEWWRFDHELHFQYHGPKIAGQEQADIADVMSSVGACFFMRRDRFWDLDGLDEQHGSWGQYGTEIACKSWLSGGRHVVNRRTYFSHLFRTQGIGFGFPYPIKSSDQEYARQYSRNLWLGNHWPKQIRPLSWLIDHFKPVKGWYDREGAQALAQVNTAGERFISNQQKTPHNRTANGDHDGGVVGRSLHVDRRRVSQALTDNTTKGLVYYSDCRGDPRILQAVREQIVRAAPRLPIVSVTLQPVAFGRNLVLPLERGYLTMVRQILTGLEASEAEVVFFVEHDVLYHPSHFEFVPPTRDDVYYNQYRWQVDATTGRAVHYRCCQTSGLCADRQLLIGHYRKRLDVFERDGYHRNNGFEPGTNAWSRSLDGLEAATWMAAYPNLDIRHGRNLTKTRWSVAEFRDKRTCQGWTESDTVPGWGKTLGRFDEFLSELSRQPVSQGAA